MKIPKIGGSQAWLAFALPLVGLIIAIAFGLPSLAIAAQASAPSLSNDECLACHGEQGMTVTLESEEILLLSIDAGKFAESVHNVEEIACVDCHTDITEFPHPELAAHSLRELSLDYYTSCKVCHQEEYDKTLDSMHERSLAGGNTNAAICTDCHNPHTQGRMTYELTGDLILYEKIKIPVTCARCHNSIYETYKESVHGENLTENYNQDVPSCIDCHGVHNIQDPRTTEFKVDSPELCASCHTDTEIMGKYNISTDVLESYVADFHGTTVTLFEQRYLEQDTNKPVCFDCHGIHDIKSPDDPEHGIAIKENLLITCQRCHPEADASFPDSWMSHYIPDADHYPAVYYIDLFYKFLIPIVLGGMLVFVISDMVRRMINKKKGASHNE